MPSAGSLGATFVAGLLSFLAPCTLPLLPGWLAYMSGIAAGDLADPARRARYRPRLLGTTLLYVAGFTVVFVLVGLGAGGVGSHVRSAGRGLEIAGGVLLVVMGLFLAGALRPGMFLRERRLELPRRLRAAGPWAAFPLGVVFGVGWTPCVGPYLGAALTLAGVSGHALEGAVLLLAYALGLGLPMIAVALVGASLPEAGRRAARLAGPLARAGGIVMVGLGVVLLAGEYGRITSALASISVGR
ncbi:MAG TPA: cytochrome c biogenesis protein CcdA [Candidatus Dormibacteraeota bacterium]|nr:cytochrome c biogenesis protein CcdA [Candidatus Dormibacteraeota bacterium]